MQALQKTILGASLLALASCATTKPMPSTRAEVVLQEPPPRATEWHTMEIDTVPQGAAIFIGDHLIGYSPIKRDLLCYVDDGHFSEDYVITAVPTSPDQFRQQSYIWAGTEGYGTYTLFMYNNAAR